MSNHSGKQSTFHPHTSRSNNKNNSAPRPPPPLHHTSQTHGFYRVAAAAAASKAPPIPAAMEDRETMAVAVAPRGSLMQPHELGVAVEETPSSEEAAQSSASLPPPHPNVLRVRQRALRTIQRSRLYEAQQQQHNLAATKNTSILSLSTSFTYKGMSIIVGTTEHSSVYIVCARTRMVLQELQLEGSADDDNDDNNTPTAAAAEISRIVSLTSHPTSGQVVIVQENGILQSFVPEPTDPTKHVYGRFQWLDGGVCMDCRQFLYEEQQQEQEENDNIEQEQSSSQSVASWHVSVSMDYKVLVAHGTQLMVLDTNPYTSTADGPVSPSEAIAQPKRRRRRTRADVLWMARLPSRIVTASMSGDGHAIAVVCQRKQLPQTHEPSQQVVAASSTLSDDADKNNDDDDCDGVHTFERDSYDGSEVDLLQSPSKTTRKGLLLRSRSVGIVYKPGPFLIHNQAVTRVSFRGHGHDTSSSGGISSNEKQGNDLLLTYSEQAMSAKIFCQNGWRPLIEWDTPARTRVDWVKGVAAFTLGDLETAKKKSAAGLSSGPPSRRPSFSEKEATAINESLGKRQQHYQSIPSHASPYSHAGAWISEITFQGPSPAIRLSRLTYLKRGVDELNPTLFENVSAFLPVGLVSQNILHRPDDSYLSIEGVWPAWNPWLSETLETASATETLRGSAMSFLGLSTGPTVATGGNFSDGVLGSTQSPPSELRIIVVHPVPGRLTSLEFPLLGDQDWTALELGNPKRAVVLLNELDIMTGKKQVVDRIHKTAAVDFESSRLVARYDGAVASNNEISIVWRKHGPPILSPSNWMPEDVHPDKAVKMLTERRWFKDESINPVPVELQSLRFPVDLLENESVVRLLWWSDESYGGLPLLVAILSQGTIVVFEVVPPWSSEQPVLLQKNDAFPECPVAKAQESLTFLGELYEVLITPDSEFGLGLRLEVLQNGTPAVAGSFKQNPVSGDALPAQQTGLIVLGDELVSANGINLEDKVFDDIVATVRDIGATCGPGNPMKLVFRRMTALSTPTPMPPRRSADEIIGIKNSNSDRSSDNLESELIPENSRPQIPEHYSVMAIFRRAIKGFKQLNGSVGNRYSRQVLVALDKGADQDNPSCILYSSEGNCVTATLLEIQFGEREEKVRCSCIGEWRKECNDVPIVQIAVKQLDLRSACISVCDAEGIVSLVLASLESKDADSSSLFEFRSFDMARQTLESDDLVLHSDGASLLAMMQRDAECRSNGICVWYGRPDPFSLDASTNQDCATASEDKYCFKKSIIKPDAGDRGHKFVDFRFTKTGFLDSSPSIVAFSGLYVTFYSRQGGGIEWLPTIRVSYKSILVSVRGGLSLVVSGKEGSFGYESPQSTYSHLVPAMLSAYSSLDEKDYLCADWHPESLLAGIVTDNRGPLHALDERTRQLFLWLCSEGTDIPEDYLVGRLVVAPITVVGGAATQSSCEGRANDAADPLSFKRLQKLLDVLTAHCSLMDAEYAKGRETQASQSDSDEAFEIRPILKRLCVEDIHILRALCELLLDSPMSLSVDLCGEHFIFSARLLEKIRKGTPEDGDGLLRATASVPGRAHVLKNAGEMANIETSSAGCLAALLSSSQAQLLGFCKHSGKKLDWKEAKRLRLPFWVRSDAALAQASEEIGQNMFRSQRDIMEAALFFIVAGKTRTLKNLAAADSTENGRKFCKFMSSYDFTTEKGRRAAEKNGFSLLRKCKYRAASAFFLLAEPPFLTAAVETIATKMKDFDLAFLVARLMESDEVSSSSSIGGLGLAFGGGGGAGYASPSVLDPPDTGPATKFCANEWIAGLKKVARNLLIERSLPATGDDGHFSALQLLWLGKHDTASWVCTGTVRTDNLSESVTPTVHERVQEGSCTRNLGVAGASVKANLLIDCVSSPTLLKAMNASLRSRRTSAMTVARTLNGKGAEIAAIQSVLSDSFSGGNDARENGNQIDEALKSSGKSSTSERQEVQSSIFDDYDAQPTKQGVSRSIFDSFDPPPSNGGGTAPSSIAAEFGIHKKPTPTAAAVQSSIFDDFDMPQPQQAKVSPSIFDSFDLPVPVKPSSVSVHVEEMQSSIFDAFDTPAGVVSPLSQTKGITGASVVAKQYMPEQSIDESEELLYHISSELVTPLIWDEWTMEILVDTAARRLIREIATVLAESHGDVPETAIEDFYQSEEALIPSSSSGILQTICDAEHLYDTVQSSLDELCLSCNLPEETVVQNALRLLRPPHQHLRTLITVVLLSMSGRGDLAEFTVRITASNLMSQCYCHALMNDDLVQHRQTRAHVASQYLRRRAASVSWQLESCLWLHRGGGLPLSSVAMKETIIAVRVGLLVASWNHNHECTEAMIRSDPDCSIDEEAGRQMWTSLKSSVVTTMDPIEKNKVSSGGWEFLVDCRRSEATTLLKDKKTGCFIIRPHPGDNGVFTLSFKTNLIPKNEASGQEPEDPGAETSGDDLTDNEGVTANPSADVTVKKKRKSRHDDSVQHAVLRLSESGYRCGSFGPFTTLISLLEAVSASLPFDLRFDLPPTNRVIQEEGSQPSPNAVFLRKLSLSHADSLVSAAPDINKSPSGDLIFHRMAVNDEDDGQNDFGLSSLHERQRCFGVFLELLVLTAVRKQLCNVAAAEYIDATLNTNLLHENLATSPADKDSLDGGDLPWRLAVTVSGSPLQDRLIIAHSIMDPLLTWCKMLEIQTAQLLSPTLRRCRPLPGISLTAKMGDPNTSIEDGTDILESGNAIIRRMIQRDSGVNFSTLKLVDGGDNTIVVIFSQEETINWLVSSKIEDSVEAAMTRLKLLEDSRVIESLDLSTLPLKQRVNRAEELGIRYRILDPWEVEALQSWEGETLGASLGRERYLGFNLGKVGRASEMVFRSLGGLKLLELWTSTKGGVVLTKALASIHPVWESSGGGDFQLKDGAVAEPTPFENSIRQHLYRNSLFRRLDMPQRFLAIVQVELLDLKNLTAPGGLLSMSVYALLRLKRDGSNAELTNKSRTLDTAVTHPVKLGKSSGPNAPASWGNVVRFRFPLPEDAWVDGTSFDNDRELLFKGPPRVLQVSVYEKKLLVDHSLGTADIRTDGLCVGGQLEEWVPLRNEKHGITWFARVRLTLRFELMCLATTDESRDLDTVAPSVGLRKITELSRAGGGSHEDVRKSVSSPDLVTYFESMVY